MSRPHRSLGQQPPKPPPEVTDLTAAGVRRRAILGGLVNEYSQAASPNPLHEPHRLRVHSVRYWNETFLYGQSLQQICTQT
jgi:hypothetical protein